MAMAPAGPDLWATAWPGFKGFRGFCLPLAGGFKGVWWRLAGDEFYSRSAAAANRQHYNSPLNQPVLWAEPEPSRAAAR